MITPEEIRQRIDTIWTAILADGQQGHGFDARRIDATLPLPCYAAVRNADGAPCILIDPVDPAIDHAAVSFEAAGLRVYVRRLAEAGTSLVLALEDVGARGLFAHLAADVVHAASLETDCGLSLRVLVQRLRCWQAFLRRASSLSDSEVLGLIGELTVLEGLAAVWGWRQALAAWVGPGGADHDFVRDDKALEVKATLQTAPHLRISNLGQLDTTGLERLYIVLAAFKRSEKGETLPTLVARLHGRITDADLAARLDGMLLEAGYSPAQADRYVEPRVVPATLRVLAVVPGFPRLVAQTVPEEIVDVSYVLEATRLDRFAVKGVDHPDALAKLLGRN